MLVMHIITRLNRGGTSTWLKTLTDNNFKEFKQILVFGSVDKSETEDHFYLKRDFRKLKFLQRQINPIADVRAYFELRQIILDLKPNVINTHTFKAGLIGRLAARKVSKEVRIVHTYHGHLIYGYYGKLQSLIFLRIEKWLAKSTDIFITNGSYTKRDLVESGVATADLFKVILPGVRNKSKTNVKRKTIRVRFGINSKDLIIGWLGRVTSIKNPELVLQIAKCFPKIWFLVGGDGEMLKTLKNSATKNVIFLGWVSPAQFWPSCDVAILTSRNEAAPYSLIEALGYGLPIISSNVGSVRDVVNSRSGFLVNDKDGFCAAIEILLKDKGIRLRMAKQSKTFFVKEFSLSKFLSKHKSIYINL